MLIVFDSAVKLSGRHFPGMAGQVRLPRLAG